jgi:hypothetical protein
MKPSKGGKKVFTWFSFMFFHHSTIAFCKPQYCYHLESKEIFIMRKYFILLGMVALMTANMYAQYPPTKQGPIVEGADLTFDAVLYLHLTITNRIISDTLNFGIHLSPVDTIRAYADYSTQLRFRSRVKYNMGWFDVRDQGNLSTFKPSVGNQACVDTVRVDTLATVEGFHVWFSVHFMEGATDISRYDVFIKKDGSSKIDTIGMDCAFRNNIKPPALRIWSLVVFELTNPNVDVTNPGIVDNVGDIPGGQSVENINLAPAKFALRQNYPNPFNPETRIQFGLPERGYVRLSVYNMLGQVVSVLVNGELPAGTKEVVWNGMDQSGRSVTSGVYFYKLETPQGAVTKKMTLVK